MWANPIVRRSGEKGRMKRKMWMRRFIPLGVCGIIVSGVLGGCGEKPADTQTSSQQEREAFKGDMNRMPPEARQKIEAMRSGARTNPTPR